MSRIHAAPQDSVRIFQDVKAKRALAMHWGFVILLFRVTNCLAYQFIVRGL